MMNKSLLVAVFVLVLVAVKQSYGEPVSKRSVDEDFDDVPFSQAGNIESIANSFTTWLQSLLDQQEGGASVAVKRVASEALLSTRVSEMIQRRALASFYKAVKKLQAQGDIRIAPSKRVTADAYMNSKLRQQFYKNQGSALLGVLSALQNGRNQGKRSGDEIEKRNASEALLATLLRQRLISKLRDATRESIMSSSMSQRGGRRS
ncbi:uncharacterized protein LOC144448420 isoform X2 [Glandiceps talaboti]